MSCADCKIVDDMKTCGKLNNFISKIFAFVFRSNRLGSLDMINDEGYDAYAATMSERKSMSVGR